MNEQSLGFIFLSAAIINNFVLAWFLGICPFLGVSGKLETATRMGIAVTFVMLISSASAWALNLLLGALGAEYLRLISFIAVIASSVQLVEMLLKKYSPALFKALGIYLPLITTNCAILAVALFQTNREYSLVQSLVFALGAGGGFTLALVLMSGLREELELADVPSLVKGTALTLMIAGVLSLSFMGFAGLGGE
ncbi:MAG: RnfABCDGE type electron transport complex subunit A [Calditrichaeota bacterium]|nr:RnfABCDGE type electron transport complex subunit A [Candidatus Cloacimonadota bacterium]MCA9785854.1 RnfABCDGE type electron transport complex subunit A [Candidatus Cloacimonadota bacterium]MCB1047123.1 RnfABCDGE type electron transport complex subunit A [Calditrichota bacterium]MCB9473911.1 RnfABCDGE type electron transport complex subunit A [Candidatus Delongbacteria bacterium]